MAFTIVIGERVLVPSGDPEVAARPGAAEEEAPEAPAFEGDVYTGRTNVRRVGYGDWAVFCRTSGLHGLFFDPGRGLMREHPGCEPLTAAHLGAVRAARLARERARPGARPGFGGDLDPVLARLGWLDWWMARALARCRMPVFANR
ncbi:MAG TPA: hypothetical protein VFS43_14895 [Polyangiaceae bacterium]|nr:hypothetical protein [Polyangiaceae bacterium]